MRTDGLWFYPEHEQKGELLDNAVAESFFHKLNTGSLYDYLYETLTEAIQCIFEHIEMFYN